MTASGSTPSQAALKLHEALRKDAGEYDIVHMRAEMGRIIEVFRDEVPPERWPYVQARLRREELPGAPRPQQVESVRMVEISDEPDEDGN